MHAMHEEGRVWAETAAEASGLIMIMFEVFLALLCLLYIKGGLSGDPGPTPSINTAPSSLVVPLYTLANFTCEGIGVELNWLVRIDGTLTQLSNAIMQQRNITICCTQGNLTITQENITICTQIGNLSSILSVNALPINNGLNIECQIVSFPPFKQVFSNAITLTIRGVSSVEDIQWSTETQLLSWSPPSFYSQDVINYALIKTFYNVLVNDISIISTTESVSLTNLTSNILCTIFRVSITTYINSYNSTSKTKIIDNTGNCTINIVNFNLILSRTSCTYSANLSILVDCSIHSCSYSVLGKVSYYKKNRTTETYQPIEIKTDEIEEEVSYLLTELEGCSKCEASIDMNYLNVTKYQDSIVATYSCIQQLSKTEADNGSVNLQCVFVSGSTADGFHMIFTDTNNGRNESFNITGPNGTTIIISLPAGNYTVVAVADEINEKLLYQSSIQHTFSSTSYNPTSSGNPISSGNPTPSDNPTPIPKDSNRYNWLGFISLAILPLLALVWYFYKKRDKDGSILPTYRKEGNTPVPKEANTPKPPTDKINEEQNNISFSQYANNYDVRKINKGKVQGIVTDKIQNMPSHCISNFNSPLSLSVGPDSISYYNNSSNPT